MNFIKKFIRRKIPTTRNPASKWFISVFPTDIGSCYILIVKLQKQIFELQDHSYKTLYEETLKELDKTKNDLSSLYKRQADVCFEFRKEIGRWPEIWNTEKNRLNKMNP